MSRTLEQRIVRHVIRELRAAGFAPESVWDGGEYVKTPTEASAMRAVFAVDDATIHFEGGDAARSHGVYFVLGNGLDVLSDWHCGDAAFNAALERVSDWVNALEAKGVQS